VAGHLLFPGVACQQVGRLGEGFQVGVEGGEFVLLAAQGQGVGEALPLVNSSSCAANWAIGPAPALFERG
jgi:hypothetical protein